LKDIKFTLSDIFGFYNQNAGGKVIDVNENLRIMSYNLN